MTTLTIAHDLVLLSLDPETGARRAKFALGHGLVGALLGELALAGRIGIEGKKVVVLDPSPTGSPRVDDLLRRLATEKPRTAQAWAQRLRDEYLDDVLAELCTAEIVRRDERRWLGVMDDSRYPQLGSSRRDALLSALRGVMVAGLAPTDPRTPVLGALVVAVGLHGRVFTGVPRRDLQKRLDELNSAGWATKAVADVVAAVQAAIAAGGVVS